MKNTILLVLAALLLLFAGIMTVSLAAPEKAKEDGATAATTDGQPDWEIPVAAGVWYPTDGPVPEKPMRYYRARCWPGCHTGSSYGKYPKKALQDHPIWPTSTVKAHTTKASNNE